MTSAFLRHVRGATGLGACLAAAVLAAAPLPAQVTPPNIRKPIETAKNAAGKTTEQIKAAERAGGAGDSGATMQAAGAQKAGAGAAPAARKAAPQKGAPQKGVARDSGAASQEGRQRGAVTIYREAFNYNAAGRRDPFVSLMLSGELRPIFTDLELTGVIFDSEGRRSVALLVDNSTSESYRVRVGQTLGRMKVAAIGRESVTFDFDEFGLSRSETLIIDKTKAAAAATRRP